MEQHAEQISIEIDKRQMEAMFNRFKTEAPNTMRIAMLKSFQLVGMKAVSQHMVPGKVISSQSGYTIGTAGSKLNIMTGRLARSLINSFSFAQGAAGEREGIREIVVSGKTVIGKFGSKVPYAAIHEYGGTITAKNSPYLMFKIGLQFVRVPSVKIPARPYLKPALAESKVEINSLFLQAINSLGTRVSGN